MVYCAGKFKENLNLFYKSNRTYFGSSFTSFFGVLSTSRVGYHAGKPIGNVVYCLTNTSSYMYVYLRFSKELTHIRFKTSYRRRPLAIFLL